VTSIADDKYFLTRKMDPNNKYLKYFENKYKNDSTFEIDYKKKAQAMSSKMEKKEVKEYMENLRDPRLQKVKNNM